ncbi:uncharacterized protein PG998_012849 [Apiospora kogelbergensis]|uniref:uncharacterized protein n=1 Tax=Apiospora kogelbergensis TaxID=1337665 RepID=UPI00312EEBF7
MSSYWEIRKVGEHPPRKSEWSFILVLKRSFFRHTPSCVRGVPALSRLLPPRSDRVHHIVGHDKWQRRKQGSIVRRLQGFFSKPFRAATDALRPKPEPLVTPLCQAASYGSVAQLKFLLAEGANIDGRDEEGKTALVRAVAADQLGALEYLLKAGADHRVCDGGAAGRPPLFHAVDAENGGAVDLLLEYGASALQRHDWSGEPYLANLVRRRGATSPEWLELLLSRGGGADAAGLLDCWMQPLVVVALQKSQQHPSNADADDDGDEVVRLLLRHGASPDTRDASGYPLLHLCAAQGRGGLVRHLLELGADPGSSDINGTPLLVTAAKRHDVALVQTLLEHGADANAHDMYLKHVLLVVLEDSKLGHADKVSLLSLLLQHGAQPHQAHDVWNVTPLEKALGPFLAAVEGAEGARTGKRRRRRCSRSRRSSCGTARTRTSGCRELAELALDCGADANLADDEADPGRAPLALAARSGDRRLVEMLLENGARVERGTMSGPGPVMETVVRSGNNNPEIVRLLKA